MAQVFVFDVETDGVKASCNVLEACYALIDMEELAVKSWGETLVLQPLEVIRALEPDVREMHETSGLLADLYRASAMQDGAVIGHAGLDAWLCDIFRRHECTPASVYLCGMSIQFDRKRLERHCPNAINYLSHRQLDISTVRELLRFWATLGAPQLPKTEVRHRARGDVELAIHSLRWIRDNVIRFEPPASASPFELGSLLR